MTPSIYDRQTFMLLHPLQQHCIGWWWFHRQSSQSWATPIKRRHGVDTTSPTHQKCKNIQRDKFGVHWAKLIHNSGLYHQSIQWLSHACSSPHALTLYCPHKSIQSCQEQLLTCRYVSNMVTSSCRLMFSSLSTSLWFHTSWSRDVVTLRLISVYQNRMVQ